MPSSNKSAYTDKEDEKIEARGHKGGVQQRGQQPSKRQPGYLGDSTLQGIAVNYGVPVFCIADVLCMWGVPVPIQIPSVWVTW